MPEQLKPMDIEARSFEIITELLGDRKLDPENALVIKRAIHTTADFDYADNLVFSRAHKVNEIPNLLVVDLLSLCRQRKQRFNRSCARVDGFLVLCRDLQLGVAVCDVYAERLLDFLDILVKRAKNIDQLLDALCVDGSFCHGIVSSFKMLARTCRAIISSHRTDAVSS